GQLQGCGCTALGTFLAAPEAALLNLPLFFRDYKEVDFIIEKFRPEIEKVFEKRGYYIIAILDTGFFYLFSKTKAKTIEDMRKQKILTWFGDVETTTLEEAGIKPIKVSVPDVVTSLQTGLINADIAPPVWQMATQAYVHTNYYVTQPLFYSIGGLVIDKNQIDSITIKYPKGLDKEIIKLTMRLIKNLEKEWKDQVRDFEAKSLRAFEKSGMVPVDLHPEDLEQFHKISGNVWKKLEGKLYPKELLDKVNTALKEFRARKKK
ncbi:MAG TPA: TRAP transporter substrate-binding protein DctP, partial [bacterium]